MKKRVAILALILLLILAIPVSAVTPRAAVIQPGLSFNGTKANCSLVVVGDLGTESISATITLKKGTKTIATWSSEDVGELVFSNSSTTVSYGETYTLTASVTINDKEYAPASITATND